MNVESPSLPSHWQHQHLPRLDSTMEYLKDVTPSEGEVMAVSTDFQTAGRGQRGNYWESEAGKNLIFSFVWSPQEWLAHRQFLLSEVVALAVATMLDKYVATGIAVKWPNDVYYDDYKICGMLLEHTLSAQSIEKTLVGIGVNVAQQRFESDAPNPISLCHLLESPPTPITLLADFVDHFEQWYALARTAPETVDTAYRKRLYRGTGWHRYQDNRSQACFEARIVEVSPIGLLTLQLRNGECRSYGFKEVKFIL